MLASILHLEKTRFLGHLKPPKTYLKRQTHRTWFPDFFGCPGPSLGLGGTPKGS